MAEHNEGVKIGKAGHVIAHEAESYLQNPQISQDPKFKINAGDLVEADTLIEESGATVENALIMEPILFPARYDHMSSGPNTYDAPLTDSFLNNIHDDRPVKFPLRFVEELLKKEA